MIDAQTGEIRSQPRELRTLSAAEMSDREAATRRILAVLESGDLETTREMLKRLGLAHLPQSQIDEARASLRTGFRKALSDPALAAKVVAAP